MQYCVEVCCMQYGNAFVDAETEKEAEEKARALYEQRRIDWTDEEIKALHVNRA